MSAFDDSFVALMGNEGGYSNDLKDPGGETMWGITEKVARANGYIGAMKDLPLPEAKRIAKICYWDPHQCDQFDPRIAFQIFDAAYNGGRPAQWLQQAVGVTPDGIIGAQTIGAVRAADPLKTIMRFSAHRLKYLEQLANWGHDSRGWADRIANNLLKGAA